MANTPPQTKNQQEVTKIESHRSNSEALEDILESEELYRTLVYSLDDAIAVLSGATVVECNAAALELFGGSTEDFIGKKPWDISPVSTFSGSPSRSRSREYIREAYAGKSVRFDWTHQKPDGAIMYLDVTLTRIDLSAGKRVLAILRDMTDQRLAILELERRVEFQSRLDAMSNEFSVVTEQDISHRIWLALREVGENYNLDRVRIWWDCKHTNTAITSHCWSRDERSFELLQVPLEKLRWSRRKLMSGECYFFDKLDDLPADALGDREFCAEQGVKSMFVSPVSLDNQFVGDVSFALLETERKWSDSVMVDLRLFAQLIASAWRRSEQLRSIREHENDLIISQRVAQVGSFTQTARPGKSIGDEFGILKMSDEACSIFDFEPGTESVELVISRIHADDRGETLKVARESIRNGTNHAMDYRIVRPDDTVVYVEERAEFEFDVEGQPVRWFGTVIDVTDRIKANEDLADALGEIRQLKDQLHDENVYLRGEVRSARRAGVMVGQNPRFKSVLVAVEKVAPTDVTVLVLGETGTGKELVAREIHELSNRRTAAMISVNCAALSSELIESELFGHESGAFTGAQKRRAGRFELADGGTLFLDEIGDLSSNVQAKILRVLQAGEFERLGGNETLNVDVRLIAATNRNLRQMVKDGIFRADLFFRINSFPIELPPLRERLDDISLLANHFLDKHREQLGQHIESIAPQMIHYIQAREWPGNVRELESFIQRAMIACSDSVLDYTEQDEMPDTALSRSDAVADSKCVDLDAVQEQHILSVLNRCNWVIDGEAGAAVVLGLPPSTLRSRMKRLGIQRPQQH